MLRATPIPLMGAPYAPRIRAERLIATSRAVLAMFALVVLWLDREALTSPREATTYFLLIGYWVYALTVVWVVWRPYAPPARLGLVTHMVDLSLFVVLTYLAKRPTNPLFTYFMFAIVAATVRWQWRGALWTAMVALLSLNGIGVFAALVIDDPEVELELFTVRSVYLAVMAALMIYLGAYQDGWRRVMSQLAAWPQVIAQESLRSPRDALQSAAQIVGARRVLMAWAERDEGSLHLTLWDAGQVHSWRVAPETFHPLIAEPLRGRPFLSADVRAPVPEVRYRGPDAEARWRGTPIHAALQSRFAMAAVLCLPLQGECLDGHLFVLDKPGMTADDLLLGEVVSHHVATAVDQTLLVRRLRRAAAVEEHHRLSRDLHDSVLQSLTAVALQLQTVQRLWDSEPRAASLRLAGTQLLIAHAQRDLRTFIREPKPAARGPGDAGLRAGLVEVAQRLERIWDLRVALQLDCADYESPDPLANDICLIVQEAVANAARHGAASDVCVALARVNGVIQVVVTDNGRGFPFAGEYDDVALTALQRGPVMLKERVKSLGGTLAIRSTSAGARLDIMVPLRHGDD